MPTNGKKGDSAAAAEKNGDQRRLSEAALGALAEAEARRVNAAAERPRELRGRDGPDPVRYGDWEVKGLATDF